ncbi:S1C family serine protease [Rubrivivax rivuli]|uniref:Serine protease n=1 Tax=Rubrivivax rivuli TaxID=1862385 RepID=A0A437RSR3_9BURK|nr:serine protease [Rubrivivax rivuli]RVU49803.1 serine protease [Rubrivivax rivuli]
MTEHLPGLVRRRAGLRALGAVACFFLGHRPQAAAAAEPAGDLRALVRRHKAAVLPVGTYSPTDSPRFGFRGSGFVVAGEGGAHSRLLATNFHVLPDGAEDSASVRMAVWVGGGETPPWRLARVVAADRFRDLAVLELEGPALAGLVLAADDTVQEGQAIALMGFPIGSVLGYSVVTHRGIVSSITAAALPAANARQLDPRAVSRLREGNFQLLQLDATAYPGNSGGPVFDVESGHVVGVLSSGLVKAGRESALSSPTGITYAVPVAPLRALMRQR